MSKMSALEAFKIRIVLEDVSLPFTLICTAQSVSPLAPYIEVTNLHLLLTQMMEKLTYLENLKNNMGEEMAEMMSEEITKVMEEQRNIEAEYARLVAQRDQLKGITNKHKLAETKQAIMVSIANYERTLLHETVTVFNSNGSVDHFLLINR